MQPKEVKITASIFFGKPKRGPPTDFDLPDAIFEGRLTKIAQHFNSISDRDVEYILTRKDDHGRTPLDLACFLGFRNIVVYLLSWGASPSIIDNLGRNAFYSLCYRGEYESCRGILQFIHFSLRQRFQYQVHSKKRELKFKNMDIKQGHLVSTVFHDEETVKRHSIFNMAIQEAFSSYCSSVSEFNSQIIGFYREALDVADKHGRNALHFGSMSKWTKCFKTIQSLIEISYNESLDRDFVRLMAEIEQLEVKEHRHFDPRKSQHIVQEVEQLMLPSAFKKITKIFREEARALVLKVLNQQDVNGHSPLHTAAYHGDYVAVRYFLKAGADPNLKDFKTSANPLDLSKDKLVRSALSNLNEAAYKCDVHNLVHLVNCGNKIDAKSSIFGEAPIHKSVITDKPENVGTLQAIIDCGANVDTIDANGWTALHHACYKGDPSTAAKLIQNKADINAFSNNKKTPLHFAALQGHHELITILLSNQAEIECRTEEKCTPLHLACRRGHLRCVQVLLSAGADLYGVDFRQWSALHYAAYNGHAAVVNYLVKWDADFDKLRRMRNSQHKLAFEIVKGEDTKHAFQHLWFACANGDLDMVRILHREGEDLNQQTQLLRNTPLHISVACGNMLIVKYLVENGAQGSLSNHGGLTAIDLAEKTGNKDVISVLLSQATSMKQSQRA